MTRPALISAAELHGLLGRADLKILDATYGLPPRADGIPGAADFDIDDIADRDAPLAHTIPTAGVFAAKAGALGVGDGDLVAVYDRAGVHMAASRAWWMFRLFGHDNVRVLDGGLDAWIAAGYSLAPKPPPAPASFTAKLRPGHVVFLDDVRANLERRGFTLIDARAADRYAGAAPEPRPGLAAGHVPGSVNLPFAELIDPATRKMKPRDELARIVRAKNIDLAAPAACTCGSGVTACVVALALHELGAESVAVYDGSWAEWGGLADTPKETGA